MNVPPSHGNEKEHRRLLAGAVNWLLGLFSGLSSSTNGQVLTSDGNGGTSWTSAGGGIAVEDEGVSLSTSATKLNFVGAGVSATEPVTDEITVTIAGGAGVSQLADLSDVGTAAVTSGFVLVADGTDYDGRALTTADIASGTFADARVAASNVTQHVASIDHDSLLNFDSAEHFTQGAISIPLSQASDVTITSITNSEILQYNSTGSIWENQTLAEAGISAVGHTHVKADITDFVESDYATGAEGDLATTAHGWGDHALAGYLTGNQTITLSGDATGSGTTAITVTVSDDSHNHTVSTITDFASNLAGTTNTTAFTPTADYHVATKKYVDDNAGGGGGGGVDAKPGAFSLSTSHNITTTESTIPFDTEEFDPDTNYSNTSGEITVTDAGYYHVAVNVPINDDGTAGATRGAVFGFLQRDQTTGTWTTVNNIRGQVYEREASGGTGFHAGGIVSLSAGEVIRFRVDVSSTVDVSTESGEASLNIFKIRGA